MKFFVVFALVCAVAAAAPAGSNNPDALATIVEQNADIDPQGNFQYSWVHSKFAQFTTDNLQYTEEE